MTTVQPSRPEQNECMQERKNVTVFLHIPKTAGVSLFHVVKRQYRRDGFFKLQFSRANAHWNEFLESGENIQRIDTYFGHFEFGVHEEVGAEGKYVTLVREPISRVVSLYDNMMRCPTSLFWHKPCPEKSLTLREFMEGGYSRHALNGQTRMLLGQLNAAELGPSALANAVANVRQHFLAVGLTERFDESLLYFKKVLGWKRHICYQRQNASPVARPVLSAADKELIEAYNRVDIELYRQLSEEFREQAARAKLSKELPWLARKNRVYTTCLPLLGAARAALATSRNAFAPAVRTAD